MKIDFVVLQIIPEGHLDVSKSHVSTFDDRHYCNFAVWSFCFDVHLEEFVVGLFVSWEVVQGFDSLIVVNRENA